MGSVAKLESSTLTPDFPACIQNWVHVFRKILPLTIISSKTFPPVLQDIKAPDVLTHHLSDLGGTLTLLTHVGSQSDATVRPDENLVMPALTSDLERHHGHTRNLFQAVRE
tara:strand:- start:190 stop:522 length:333 start_codon:yes stop_codon:yes gene_type:complete